MASLTSYIFKPKHGKELAKKVIEAFCNDFLNYEDCGNYLWWRDPVPGSVVPLPEGYVEFHIENDYSSDPDSFSESCYLDTEITAQQMADDMYVLLNKDFWYPDHENGGLLFSFEDRELCEVIVALADPSSRVVSFGSDRRAFVSEVNSEGVGHHKSVDLLDYALAVPIVEEKPQGEQLKLTL